MRRLHLILVLGALLAVVNGKKATEDEMGDYPTLKVED